MALLAGIIKEVNGIVKVKSPNGKSRIVTDGDQIFLNDIIIIEEEGSTALLKTFIPSELLFFDHTHVLIDEKLLYLGKDTVLSDSIHDLGQALYLSHETVHEIIQTKISGQYEGTPDKENFFKYDENGFFALQIGFDDTTVQDNTPALTGSINDPLADITVIINDNEYEAVNNGDGTWTLPDNTLPPLDDGTYDVTVIAEDGGQEDTGSGTLIVDAIFPDVTIDALVTGDNTPELTGTVDDPSANIIVIIDGNEYEAVNNEDGTWTLPDNTLPPLDDGTYDVTVIATDDANNQDSDTADITIDTSIVSVSIEDKITNDNTPELNGTVNKPDAQITVSIDGVEYEAVNNGDGTWTLPDNTLPQLPDNTYQVDVTAVDSVGNEANDTAELTIDATAPKVTIDDLVTDDSTPELTGTIDDPSANIIVIIDGNEYEAVNNGDGTWTLPDDTLPSLDDGTYDVTVIAVDDANNQDSDTANVTIDTALVSVGIEDKTTNDNTPELSGTVNKPDAEVTVSIEGVEYEAVNNEDGTWTLPDNTLPQLPDNTYHVGVTATDTVGNTANDTAELTIDATAPEVAIDDLVTNDLTPELTGTIDDPAAKVTVVIEGVSYEAVNNQDGTWTLPDDVLPALSEGQHITSVSAVDEMGNQSGDEGTLIVSLESPLLSIDNIDETEDTTPTFTGKIENAQTLEVTVNGTTYSSVSGEVIITEDSWELTLPDESALMDGDYTVEAKATNTHGKTTEASDDFLVDVKPQITVNDYDIVTDRTPTFEGTFKDAVIVEVVVNNTLHSSENGEVMINEEEGTWEFTVPDENALGAGEYIVNAIAKDPQGNIVNAHDDFTLDTEEPPIANDDIILTNIIDGSTIEIPETALTFNDTDANYDYIHVESVGNAVNGTVEMPEFVGYTPTTDPFEGGSFEYTATDGKASSGAAHVEIIAVDGNIISGSDDEEILVSGQRNDMMLGGGGNDAFVCYDLSRIVDGGDGFDMLLAPYHDVINFDCFTSRVTNLEVLDVYQGDHAVILVGVNDILSVTDDNNTFKITGDSGDRVSLDPGWTDTGESVTIDAITYHVYTGELGGELATLQVQEDVSVFG